MVVKTLTRLFALLAALLVPALAIAQASLPVDAPLPTGDALTEIIALLLTLKGAGAAGITLVVVQVIMRALRTPLADKLGKWKLLALYGLSVPLSLLTAKLAGASWGAALVSGPLLAAIQNFAHQAFKHFTEKPDVQPGEEH